LGSIRLGFGSARQTRISEADRGLEPERHGCKGTILLIDSDLGFIFWLGQALDAVGYSAIPAVNTRGAAELIEEHRLLIDTLVINPLIDEALPFISSLKRTRSELKTIAAIPDDTANNLGMPDFEAIIHKPDCLTRMAVTQWVNIIQSLSSGAGAGFRFSQLLQH
jgi:hypothetical protein